MSEDMVRAVAAAQRREFGDVRPRLLNRLWARRPECIVLVANLMFAVLGTSVISDHHKSKRISGTVVPVRSFCY